jgi:hypothetical protein
MPACAETSTVLVGMTFAIVFTLIALYLYRLQSNDVDALSRQVIEAYIQRFDIKLREYNVFSREEAERYRDGLRGQLKYLRYLQDRYQRQQLRKMLNTRIALCKKLIAVAESREPDDAARCVC